MWQLAVLSLHCWPLSGYSSLWMLLVYRPVHYLRLTVLLKVPPRGTWLATSSLLLLSEQHLPLPAQPCISRLLLSDLCSTTNQGRKLHH